MICNISGPTNVFKGRYNSRLEDIVIGELCEGDVVVVIQTFKAIFNESFCVTRYGSGFIANHAIVEFQNKCGDK